MLGASPSCLIPDTSGVGTGADTPMVGDDSSSGDSSSGDGGSTETNAGPTSDDSGMDSTGQMLPPLPAHRAVTADWLAGTLSVIDLDALDDGALTREEIVTHTIDLSSYAPGPLQVEIAPDGVTAIVSISPGFYDGVVGNAIGAGAVEQDGTLLRVDLGTEQIDEIATTHVPMGIAISPDGSRAYTANYGLTDTVGSTLSVIDLDADIELEAIEVGERPEQVSLHPDGTLGIVNVVGLGAVRVFQTEDPAGTLSDPLVVGADPSDVDFIAGTPYAIVANSVDPSNYVVLDVSDPSTPTQVSEGPAAPGVFYAATSIPGTTDVMLVASNFLSLYVSRVEIDADGMANEVLQTTHELSSFPLGLAVDVPGGQLLMPTPGVSANALVVQRLVPGTPRVIPWQDEIGPTYVAVAP